MYVSNVNTIAVHNSFSLISVRDLEVGRLPHVARLFTRTLITNALVVSAFCAVSRPAFWIANLLAFGNRLSVLNNMLYTYFLSSQSTAIHFLIIVYSVWIGFIFGFNQSLRILCLNFYYLIIALRKDC